ncbi:hypothetical protein MKW98_017770 [Papaver atlanticum]|uniref:Small multi-drug export protein n=1 Tax=Papaver atlanticum TaxID=357466 RepID=A0AAD4XT75_9MAGN|nr:hypothetical protein MKW98_017770 [Papaver atlanticum]
MAVITPSTTTVTNFFPLKTHRRISPINTDFIVSPHKSSPKPKFCSIFHSFSPLVKFSQSTTTSAANSNNFVLESDNNEILLPLADEPKQAIKFVFWVLVWTSVSLVLTATFGGDSARAASADSIRASSFGLKVASFLRGSGWSDEVIVFALATLPLVELRGAIPVGYWLQLKPLLLTVLSVLGNMVPVPIILLYLKKFAKDLAKSSPTASRYLELFFKNARAKAGPIEEFQWLGLMLFVAVPFPGTGAWTGAVIASLFDMPFWSAVSANFCGVVLAGLLVNLLVNLGLKYAVVTGLILFFVSTFMWSILRYLKKPKLSSSN